MKLRFALLFSGACMVLLGAGHPNHPFGPEATSIAHLAARLGNGLCCQVAGGALCETAPDVHGCGYNPVNNCECLNPGSSCSVVHQPPQKHDICRAAKPGEILPPDAHCTVLQVWCWTKKNGSCDSDAGPWSWGGLCWTCGCLPSGDEIPMGTRQLCNAGSTPCS